jgi:hypothetical protein
MHFIHIKLFRKMLLHVSNRHKGSSSGSRTITNHTHCHNMITKVCHHLKCICYVDKMSLKLVFLRQ